MKFQLRRAKPEKQNARRKRRLGRRKRRPARLKARPLGPGKSLRSRRRLQGRRNNFMGQKVNPIGFRLGVSRDWRSRWYASPQELPAFLHSDLEIRNYVKKKLQFAAVSKIV